MTSMIWFMTMDLLLVKHSAPCCQQWHSAVSWTTSLSLALVPMQLGLRGNGTKKPEAQCIQIWHASSGQYSIADMRTSFHGNVPGRTGVIHRWDPRETYIMTSRSSRYTLYSFLNYQIVVSYHDTSEWSSLTILATPESNDRDTNPVPGHWTPEKVTSRSPLLSSRL